MRCAGIKARHGHPNILGCWRITHRRRAAGFVDAHAVADMNGRHRYLVGPGQGASDKGYRRSGGSYKAPCEPVPAIVDEVLAAVGDVQAVGQIDERRLLNKRRKAGLAGENLQFSASDTFINLPIRLENKELLISGIVPLELEIEDVP